MTVFATEGCASCHRLQGYESNVGFQIEKEKPNFDQLYQEKQWFKSLFPEMIHVTRYDEDIHGSQIVSQIEKHKEEIDKRIVNNVRENSLLEEIERKSPETIESFYSNFRYASRAKDDEYATLIKNEKNPEKIKSLEKEHQLWKERVHRVLMMFIQEYGLGRFIGPRPNWSGIYRSDEWLMEHFRNPSSHVPRSIMPTFPFDDTKFYSLTYMLDKLGILNRNRIQEVWNKHGFDPSEVYELLCAQCHGMGFLGKGPVAQWIYPIPKNLKDAEFLRNLTKEEVIHSITHGVPGTPMPPWGEAASDKPADIQKLSKTKPVLSEQEIHYLVEWLYSGLAGGEVIKSSKDVPKWKYEPKDVLEELKKEGGKLLPDQAPKKSVKDKLSFLPTGKGYYASLKPVPAVENSQNEVAEVFDVVPNREENAPDPYSYYIKKRYYTPENLKQGGNFFLINCATCHGADADGSGIRGEIMDTAKPRMLTNLDWIQSRDDLRLLRSIKFGVPGTAMTPWGDLTSSLQRMQLVMYIRSLTEEQEKRHRLTKALYESFDVSILTIQKSRIDIAKRPKDSKQNANQPDPLTTKVFL